MTFGVHRLHKGYYGRPQWDTMRKAGVHTPAFFVRLISLFCPVVRPFWLRPRGRPFDGVTTALQRPFNFRAAYPVTLCHRSEEGRGGQESSMLPRLPVKNSSNGIAVPPTTNECCGWNLFRKVSNPLFIWCPLFTSIAIVFSP